tara:strand:- start:498 stop:746 length:249 start_codon:yes stop_codon:yes gene_type:complete
MHNIQLKYQKSKNFHILQKSQKNASLKKVDSENKKSKKLFRGSEISPPPPEKVVFVEKCGKTYVFCYIFIMKKIYFFLQMTL